MIPLETIESIRFMDDDKSILRIYFKDGSASDFKSID